jgi:ATP-dependent DNA helicase RecG
MTIVEATIADSTGSIRAVWFNQPYIKNSLRPGREANFSGKVSLGEGEIYLSHPTYEFTGAQETKHTARLVPVYPETKGLTSKGLRFIIQPLLAAIEPIKEWLPKEILKANALPEVNEALHSIHFPQSLPEAMEAKRRFAFEDLFLLQIANLKQKQALTKESSLPIRTDVEWLKKIIQKLPFELTLTQKKSLWEAFSDEPPSSGRRRLGQNRRGRPCGFGRAQERLPVRRDGTDRSPGTAAF